MAIRQGTYESARPLFARAGSFQVSSTFLALALTPFLLAAWQMEPLYSSNQNTKYLHALAWAGLGYLHEDWLAGTKDGLPLFTWLAETIYRIVGTTGFYAATLGGYFGFLLCALAIYRHVSSSRNASKNGIAVFLAMIFVLAAVEDAKRIAFEGFAKQYLLSGYFQTADFGVLLLLSVVLFEMRQRMLTALFALAGAAFHPGYITPAAAFLIAYAAYEIRYSPKGEKISAVCIFGAGLIGLVGMSLALRSHFASADPDLQRMAHRILTEIRIPDHALPAAWFNVNVVIQLVLCAIAARLLKPSRFRFVMRFCTVALVAFSVLALLPHSETYRLIAPWRISVILVPLASFTLCAVAVNRLHENGYLRSRRGNLHRIAAQSVILCCTMAGLAFTVAKFAAPGAYYTNDVRANLAPGQQYLTPFEDYHFRLATGAPQYVNSKTHPYQDVEVLEWHRRLLVAQELYQGARMDCGRLRQVARQDYLTHVITDKGRPEVNCPFAVRVFQSGASTVFRLNPEQL